MSSTFKSINWKAICMATVIGTSSVMAAHNSESTFSDLVKSSIHGMVVDVQKAADPVVKRQIIGNYLTGMDQGLAKMASNSNLTAADRQAIVGLGLRYHTNVEAFYGQNGNPAVSDSELDAFAGFVQQQSEQADPTWNGGVFLSTGALLILIILLIIFH